MKKVGVALAVMILVLASPPAWAKKHHPIVDPPALGADCGDPGTSSIVGNNSAGQIQMGTNNTIPTTLTCTLTFSAAATTGYACIASDEGTGGFAQARGANVLSTTVTELDDVNYGDKVDYLCSPF